MKGGIIITVIIYVLIILINLLCVLLNKKNRFIGILSSIGVYLFLVGNTLTGDRDIYYNAYYTESIYQFEIGFVYLVKFFKIFNFTYDQFLYFYFALCLLLSYRVIKKFNGNLHIIIPIYLIIQIAVDVDQIRNFLSVSILSNAIFYIYNNKKFKAVIFLLLSSIIHISMLFYFPLILINKENLKLNKLIKFIGILTFIICIITFHFSNNLFLKEILLKIFKNSGKENYFLTQSKYGFILFFSMHLFTLITIYLGKYLLISKEKNLIINFILLINFYVLVSFPLIMINMSMYRLYRNLYLVNIICFSLIYNEFPKNKILLKQWIFVMILSLYSFFWAESYIIRGSNVYSYFFENNILG